MEMILLLVLFGAVAITVFAFAGAATATTSLPQQRLREILSPNMPEPGGADLPDRLEQALEPLSRTLPRSPEELSRTRNLLIQAGYREPRHVTIFYGLRGLLALLGLVFGFLLALGSGALMLGASLALLGYLAPRFLLKRKISHRQQLIRLALPDALDLTVVCVEAGLSLDQAIQRVGLELQHAHSELSDELTLVNLEIRAGKPRAEALRNLALRTGVDDVRALVAVLIQTDRFGTSVAQALRVHSDALRTERRQRAEEAAAKTTIKMVPVLVFFVFPPMFIVTIGPAIIQFIRVVIPEINQ